MAQEPFFHQVALSGVASVEIFPSAKWITANFTPEELGKFSINLASGGVHNLNFVTPTHVVPMLPRGMAAQL